MTTYSSPGVYIEEVPSGPQPIAAVATSVVAVLGATRRGTPGRPTRITSWSDFQRLFGSSAPGGFTAEAVYGFFANGGPAAYVVRVDPSTAATWTVLDAADATSFTVTASSPGAWANDAVVAVAPDLSGGGASLYRAEVTAAATVTSTPAPVRVSSVTGASVGDDVVLLRAASGAAPAPAVVQDVGDGTLTLATDGGDVDLAPGDRVAVTVPGGATTIRLAAGSGVRAGDVLVARSGDGTRTSWRVTQVASVRAGLVVTTAAGAAAVPGLQLTDRVVRFRGTLGVAEADVPLGAVTWLEDAALRPTADDMTAQARAYAAGGLQGRWTEGVLRFPSPPPAGPVEVEGRLRVHRWSTTRPLTAPGEAGLRARFSFLPEGTSLSLTPAGGGDAVVVTRTATGFTPTDDLDGDFTGARFLLPDDASRGVVVTCARPPEAGDFVDFDGTRLRISKVENPGGSIYLLSFTSDEALDAVPGDTFALQAFVPTTFAPLRFLLTATLRDVVERFPGLSLDPAHPAYFARDGVVNGVSSLVTVSARPAGAPAVSDVTTPARVVPDQQGQDQPPSPRDFREALVELEVEQEPAMVICPDLLTFDDELLQADLVDAVVRHCEATRRFAVLDAPDLDDEDVLEWRLKTVSSSSAAVYAPHLVIVNLDATAPERFRTVPPSGFVAGVFARTDRDRGVHKAPGNERVSGIVGLSQDYTARRQDLLNPGGVNLIRSFPGRGTRIWGARTATDDTTWRYVNVRRLFNAIETAVERGTQWVVFEPNVPAVWLRIKASLEAFLDQQWRAGALAGTTPEQAYRVRVGLGQTMTEADVDLGLVITEVAIAPAKPAEFVVFRFSHKRLSE